MLVFFLAKCVRTAAKTMFMDRKNQKALALLYLASKPLRNVANSSGVPTEFATELTRQIWTLRLNFSPKLKFSPSTKKTTEYSFELFFPLTNLFWLLLSLLVLLQRRSPCEFAPETRDTAHGYIKCMPLHIGDPVVRTYRRTVTWLLRHYQNFLPW